MKPILQCRRIVPEKQRTRGEATDLRRMINVADLRHIIKVADLRHIIKVEDEAYS